jgi:tRNA G10  N-methylase Trm11
MNTKTKQFGYILGRDRALSIAEILAVYKRFSKDYKITLSTKDCLILEASWRPEIKQLGGTIKIFEVLGIVKKLDEIIQNTDWLKVDNTKNRINFGISGYDMNLRLIKELGFKIKGQFEDNDTKTRFVSSKFSDLSSVIVSENKLIERGFELIVIKNGAGYIIGKTLEVQNYKAYSKRDFGRPARDDKSGMLPPKLAQILINLGEKDFDATVYDPFCGSGTVLQEALMLGYKNVTGSDISEKAVADSIENIKWLKPDLSPNIFVSDITNPSQSVHADVVVGEGYLGEPQRRDKDTAIKDAGELSKFYEKAFSNIKAILNNNGRAVIAIPFFIVGREYIYLPILDKIENLGLKIIRPEIGVNLPGRGNLTYNRPDSFVGREIILLEK